MLRVRVLAVTAVVLAVLPLAAQTGEKDKSSGITVDKEKRTIKIDAKIAPRKLPHLQEIYPIEVIATWPHPKGKKAHETIVTFDAKPSDIHKALVELGAKPGTPVMGESKDPPKGQDLKVYFEIPGPDGSPKVLSLDKTLVDKRTGKQFPKTVTWRFTGSAMTKADPNSPETVYGADLSGTLMCIFPVSNETVFQTNLTMEYERFMKLETNTAVLPKEGTPVKLVIQVPPAK